MSRYPREARNAAIKCIPCNALVTETIGGKYVPVECGDSPVTTRSRDDEAQRIAADD